MIIDSVLKKSLLRSGIYTLLLSIVFVFFSWKESSPAAIFSALPFFVVLYFIFFTLGKPSVSQWIREKTEYDHSRIILFPLFLIVLYFVYIIINGHNPLDGTLFLVPYLLFFPVLMLAPKGKLDDPFNWVDFFTFTFFVFPVTLVKINFTGDLPYNGGHFDSIYRIAVMLTAVYAFVTVRNLLDVGCYPVFNLRFLFTTIWVWLAFYLFVFAIGYGIHFIRLSTEHHFNVDIVEKISVGMVSIFLHTALFEELVFRGLLQNMLGKRIAQSASWKSFWTWGLIILIALALLAGYTLKGSMQWFPALIIVLLFGVAFGIEQYGKQLMGVYTALAITSCIFGLVHYHSGSIIFIGLACIGGWAYGYTYLKTRNVFYSALLHALVNSSPLIFGLEFAK
ncbi:MAG: CPBP family intramembrane metalloprotease [Agriterribacter sp.]